MNKTTALTLFILAILIGAGFGLGYIFKTVMQRAGDNKSPSVSGNWNVSNGSIVSAATGTPEIRANDEKKDPASEIEAPNIINGNQGFLEVLQLACSFGSAESYLQNIYVTVNPASPAGQSAVQTLDALCPEILQKQNNSSPNSKIGKIEFKY
ncbi:MAG: hypothetical protein M1383_03385 [Patescibacteria group bacterium]|nr:hypothetical protein [Patescibacteria group bacterium]